MSPLRFARRPLALAASALVLQLTAGTTRADPGYYLVTPYDRAGQAWVDLRYWSVKSPGRRERIWPELGLGYGVNSRWSTGLLVSTVGPSNWEVATSSVQWQNDIMLTQGEWPVDLALHTKLVRESGEDGRSWAFEYGPALQTDFGRTQLNANLFFERSVEPEASPPIQLRYQWQLRHRWKPLMNFGLQGFGEVGRWNDWPAAKDQSHRAGPALFGQLDLGRGGDEALLYQAAYLLGRVYRRQGDLFTVRLQYSF